jgi:hypothetical protein
LNDLLTARILLTENIFDSLFQTWFGRLQRVNSGEEKDEEMSSLVNPSLSLTGRRKSSQYIFNNKINTPHIGEIQYSVKKRRERNLIKD